VRRILPFLLLPAAAAACAPREGEPGPASPGPQAAGAEAAESLVERGPVRLRVRCVPASLPLSGTAELVVEVETREDAGVALEDLPLGTSFGPFLLRDVRTEPPRRVEHEDGAWIRHRRRMVLEPQASGTAVLPPLAQAFRLPGDPGVLHEIRSEPLEVAVQSLLPEEMDGLEDLPRPAPPRPLPAPAAPSSWWLLAAALAAAGGVLLGRRLRRRPPAEAAPEPPRERALRALEALLAGALPGPEGWPGWYRELTAVLRRFLEETTGVRAPEQTTEEFLRAIETDPRFPPARREALRAFLLAADLVKYAGQEADPTRAREAAARARALILEMEAGTPAGPEEEAA